MTDPINLAELKAEATEYDGVYGYPSEALLALIDAVEAAQHHTHVHDIDAAKPRPCQICTALARFTFPDDAHTTDANGQTPSTNASSPT